MEKARRRMDMGSEQMKFISETETPETRKILTLWEVADAMLPPVDYHLRDPEKKRTEYKLCPTCARPVLKRGSGMAAEYASLVPQLQCLHVLTSRQVLS
jgi:hypothetical protein